MNSGLAMFRARAAEKLAETDDFHFFDFAQRPDRIFHARVSRFNADPRRSRNRLQIHLITLKMIKIIRNRLVIESHFAPRRPRTILIEKPLHKKLRLRLQFRRNHSSPIRQNQLATRITKATRHVVLIVYRPELGE